MTPLFNACSQGSTSCTELLLEYGAKPQLESCLPSPTHEAASKGDCDRVKGQGEKVPSATGIVNEAAGRSLGWGGGGELCVGGGGTGLQETQTHLYFVLAGHHECLEILISWGVDVDQDIPHLGTPLYVACLSQQFHCVRKLLYAGNFLYPIFHSVCTHKQFFSFVLTSLNKLL